jgi:glycosyltransferase involved in cell wall biosynthesis
LTNHSTDSRIRLLKFLTLFAIGGTERQVLNLVRQLDRTRFDLRMACFRRWGHFLDDVLSLDIPISEYSITTLLHPNTFWQQIRLAHYLRRQRVQVLHTYGFYASVFAVPAARLARVPAIVVSVRDTGELLTESQRRAQRYACSLAHSVLVNAEAVRQWLVGQGCSDRKIRVIRNGIVFDAAAAGGRIRAEFGIPAEAPVVGMLSRLNRLKGVEFFLEAAAVLAGKFPNAHFLVVGDEPPQHPGYKKELEGMAGGLGLGGRVTFTGFRKDIPEILANLTVSVLPSLSEGFSNVLLESLAAGVPVVATTVGGNPEIVEDGVNGLLVPPRDASSLAQAVGLILDNPFLARRLGDAGRRRIREQFSVQRMVDQTEQHYRMLLGDRQPPAAAFTDEAIV